MATYEPNPKQRVEGGVLRHNLRRLAERAGNTALVGVAIIAAGLAFTETLYDFDEHLSVPFDNDEM